MVDITTKAITRRTAVAVAEVVFSNATPHLLIRKNAVKKGDVLSVARIAGIMAVKNTWNLIPLCHPISLTSAAVILELVPPRTTPCSGFSPSSSSLPPNEPLEILPSSGPTHPISQPSSTGKFLDQGFGRVKVRARVESNGKTGVEMEALVAVSVAALTVIDMCKTVDRAMSIEGIRVVYKSGGKSGIWSEEGFDIEETSNTPEEDQAAE